MIDSITKGIFTFVEGPYWASKSGHILTPEEAADPNTKPCILFNTTLDYYLYDLEKEEFFCAEFPSKDFWPICRSDIPDDIINKAFSRDLTIPKLGISDYMKFIMPLVRKTHSSLISNDIVSIQPLSSPIASIFYLKSKYGK